MPARQTGRHRVFDTYRTPRAFFLALDHEFGFTVDAAADHDNAQVERYWTLESNGLNQSWAGETVWCNPPYSDIAPWVAKARAERENGATTVLLLPARTDSPWWHEHVWGNADEIRFVRGRLPFLGLTLDGERRRGAAFPSVVVIFRRRDE